MPLGAKLGCLLDGVGGVVPAIGEPDHLRLGSLRLQQEAREIGGGERVQGLADNLAAARGDDGPQVVRHLVPERVVGHQQEPGLSALCQHRLRGTGGLRVSVEYPVKAGGRAFLVGQLRGRRPREQRDLAALARKLLHRERDRGIGEISNRGDALAVEPTARNRRGEVGLVLMISVDHLDRADEHVDAEVLDRHARREHRGRAAKVAIEAALVVEHADANRLLL